MKKEIYNKLKDLNNITKYNIDFCMNLIIDVMVINYIINLLNTEYILSYLQRNELLELIDKIKYYGNRK